MDILKQDFFDEFKCIADKCESTCCAGWKIMVDEDSLKRFKNYEGSLKKEFTENIDYEEGSIANKANGDCAFLDEMGLCEMIKREGDGILCDTCRLYPRHEEEFLDVREWSMSMSCPEIASMMVELKGIHEIEVKSNEDPDPLEDDFDDFDIFLFSKLQDTREVMFNLIEDETLTLREKMGLILELSERIQRQFDDGEIFQMEETLEDFENPEFIAENKEECEISFGGYVKDDMEVLKELEVLNPKWTELTESLSKYPFKNCDDAGSLIEGFDDKRYETVLLNILKSLIFTYFLGSIYNGMIYAYTNMCIFGTIVVDSLARAQGQVKPEDFERFLYMYSKETEHSDINIGILLEHFDLQD